jgi:hypothetical protein
LLFNSWTKAFPSPPLCIEQISEANAGSAKGADIVVGSLTDINDMRTAMTGARRASFCAPTEAGTLKAASEGSSCFTRLVHNMLRRCQLPLSTAAALSHEIFFCTITGNYTYQGGCL